jgi:putative chitinase
MITLSQLNRIFPFGASSGRNAKYLERINATLTMINANTPLRVAAFLSQVGTESAELKYTKELGGHEYLDKYDTGRLAERLGNTPADDDDGEKYCGRDWLQCTGKRNYKACGEWLGLDLVNYPELLEEEENIGKASAWFWIANEMNAVADTGDIDAISDEVNKGRRTPIWGDSNGFKERSAYYQKALTVLGK